MPIKVTRIDKSLPLPKYETSGSVGFDLIARETTVIKRNTIVLIPANVIVETPPGYMLVIASRSSTPRKKGLTQPHGIGIIDQDYCGPTDEIKIQMYNFSEQDVTVERGEKIAQAVFVHVSKFDFEEVDQIKDASRGGFGSTG